MKILLLGKNGQVGWELQRSLAVLGQVTALDHDSTGHCGDFARPDAVAATVRALQPDVIVNAAAHTAPHCLKISWKGNTASAWPTACVTDFSQS